MTFKFLLWFVDKLFGSNSWKYLYKKRWCEFKIYCTKPLEDVISYQEFSKKIIGNLGLLLGSTINLHKNVNYSTLENDTINYPYYDLKSKFTTLLAKKIKMQTGFWRTFRFFSDQNSLSLFAFEAWVSESVLWRKILACCWKWMNNRKNLS